LNRFRRAQSDGKMAAGLSAGLFLLLSGRGDGGLKTVGSLVASGLADDRCEASSAERLQRRTVGSGTAGLLTMTGRMLDMWMLLSRRLRVWVLLSIALPLARVLVHRLALAADRRDPSARTARALRQADSAVSTVSRRASRRAAR
jgi:hypothetical protein